MRAPLCLSTAGPVVVLLLLALTSGCSLLQIENEAVVSAHSLLKPVVAPREAIELEVWYIDRRIGDPLIGESLWGSLFAITAVSPEVRDELTQDGFRFAMSPSRPPRSLQSLMKLSDSQDPSTRTTRQVFTVPAGQETTLAINQIPDGTPFTRPTRDGIKTVELNQASCLFRVNVDKVEDDWAKIVIIPEIRHGEVALRPQPTANEWLYQQGQNAMTFYNDRLSAEVNVGEIVVIGLDPNAPDSLAKHFFRSDVSEGLERLIVIRISDMRTVKPMQMSVN